MERIDGEVDFYRSQGSPSNPYAEMATLSIPMWQIDDDGESVGSAGHHCLKTYKYVLTIDDGDDKTSFVHATSDMKTVSVLLSDDISRRCASELDVIATTNGTVQEIAIQYKQLDGQYATVHYSLFGLSLKEANEQLELFTSISGQSNVHFT